MCLRLSASAEMPEAVCASGHMPLKELMNFAICIDGAVRIHAAVACIRTSTCLRSLCGTLGLLIDLSKDCIHFLREAFFCILDFIHISTLADLLECIHFGLQRILVFLREFVCIVTQLLFGLIDQGLSAVERFCFFLALLVLFSIL